VLDLLPQYPGLEEVDADFEHLFHSWFNRGFLQLRPIDWHTPAVVLEKIIRYEAVHEISGWSDLRRRLDPPDRKCFAFFHPTLTDDPLIFVEVALTQDIPDAIAPLLEDGRPPLDIKSARTAVFYSISNCQKALKGVSFGNFLIKQVAAELKRNFPQLRNFVTLSPVPGFTSWLKSVHPDTPVLQYLAQQSWHADPAAAARLRPLLLDLLAASLFEARDCATAPASWSTIFTTSTISRPTMKRTSNTAPFSRRARCARCALKKIPAADQQRFPAALITAFYYRF